MDNNSFQDTCVSCGKITTYTVSYSEGERLTSCTSCGSVVKYERDSFYGRQS